MSFGIELCSLLFLVFLLVMAVMRRDVEVLVSKRTGTCLFAVTLSQVLTLADRMILAEQELSLAGTALFCAVTFSVQALVPALLRDVVLRSRKNIPSHIRRLRWLHFLPWAVVTGCIFYSVWSKGVFYVDSQGFHRGGLFWIFHVNYLIYAVGTVAYGLRHKQLMRVNIPMLFTYFTLTGIPCFLLIPFQDHPLYGVCMTILVYFLCRQGERVLYFTDTVSGALVRESFLFDVQKAELRGIRQHIFAIAIDNFKLVNEFYGVEGGNEILRKIAANLQTEFGKYHVYRFGGDIFLLMLNADKECARILDTIRHLFLMPVPVNGRSASLTACIGIVHTEHYKASEIASAVDFAVSQAKRVGKGVIFEMAENTAGLMKRRKAIEQALVKNIRDNHFEVHYQPIFDTKKKRFHSMEALARLNVPGYGYVSPEEFIRIAEKNGTILQIGMLVLEEVCRFIRDAGLKNKGIDFVEVNLSVVQCMQDKICNHIRDMLEKYDVPPEMINLEITESAAAYSEKKLMQNMARMSLMDLEFSLDDYGSGYSNINYLVSLPFSIVKIDKYLVWEAAKSVMSRAILENTINMFKEIHLKVVAEGIEDAEMADMLIRMGADYLQGYYYSKPVPAEVLAERLDPAYLAQLLEG